MMSSKITAIKNIFPPTSTQKNIQQNSDKMSAEISHKKLNRPKKVKPIQTHPPTEEMVLTAITTLKKRNGCSVQAIKKYILVNYNVDVKRFSSQLKRYLKKAVTIEVLIQTKGRGAVGSFKINKLKEKKEKNVRKPKLVVSKPEKSLKNIVSKRRKFVKDLLSTAKSLNSFKSATSKLDDEKNLKRQKSLSKFSLKDRRRTVSQTKIAELTKVLQSSFQSPPSSVTSNGSQVDGYHGDESA